MMISAKKNVIILLLFILMMPVSFKALSKDNIKKSLAYEQPEIDYEKKLDSYLNFNSKGFVEKMAVKEKFLLQLIQNITKEIQSRGDGSAIAEDVGFKIIYEEQNKLISEYTQEVENILGLITELEQLENYVVRAENRKMLGEIQDLKENLKAALENRQLYKKKIYTPNEAGDLIEEYSAELDSILNIYEMLEKFEKYAQYRNDTDILAEIKIQKRQLTKIIGLYSPESGSPMGDKLVEDYIDESDKIVKILNEVDNMNANIDSVVDHTASNQIKNSLINSIDERLLKLSGYQVQKKYQGPSVSEFFKAWRSEKLADYQARLTKYRIMNTRLLNTGSETERKRMLERAMSDAMVNYSARDFNLSEVQFKDILKNYADYFPEMDGVVYYMAESNYARSFYDVAFENYDYLVKKYSNSKFLGRSLWKMMLICYTYDWKNKFFTYFEKLKDLPAATGLESMNDAYYLAGHLYASTGKFRKAQLFLNKIPKDTEYYFAAQYLLGVVYVNLDNYTRAKKIFEVLSNKKNYPWTNANITTIRNEATIRLGFLHYQRGEYQKAIETLSQVSKGYDNYDKSLMVQAWAKLKTGQYEESIYKINSLFSDYLSSNYTYEALVLSAHCKQILDDPLAAKKDLKYVASAHSVLKLSDEYNNERRRILEQASELNRLETQILERQDKEMYQETMKIRDTINEALVAFNYRGIAGSQLINEFNDERKEIIRQIKQFDFIMQKAKGDGNKSLVAQAEKQRTRLIRVLEKYQADKSVTNINYFIDYPLATKEGGIQYRRGIIKNMFQEIVEEKQRLERDIKVTMELLAQHGDFNNVSSQVDLEILEEDLASLKNRLNRLQIWLADNPVNKLDTNFDQWADFSGFGMSDINFRNLLDSDNKIATYSKNIELIDQLLSQKQKALETKIASFDKKMAKIMGDVDSERIRLEKLERKKYFQNIYFDTKEKEVKRKTEDEEFERMLEEELRRSSFEEELKDKSDKKKDINP